MNIMGKKNSRRRHSQAQRLKKHETNNCERRHNHKTQNKWGKIYNTINVPRTVPVGIPADWGEVEGSHRVSDNLAVGSPDNRPGGWEARLVEGLDSLYPEGTRDRESNPPDCIHCAWAGIRNTDCSGIQGNLHEI